MERCCNKHEDPGIKETGRRYRIARLPLYLSVLLSGCSTLISDEFPEYEPQPVLNSILVAGQPVQALISYAEKIDTTWLEGTADAEVYYDSDQVGLLQLANLDSGWFYHTYVPEPGEIVTLRATMPGLEEAFATDTIPEAVTLEILAYAPRAGRNEEGNYRDSLTLRFTDNPDTRDFYELVLRKRYEERTANIHAFNDHLDILLNEGIDPHSTPTLLFSDEMFRNSRIEMQLGYSSGCSGSYCYSSTGQCYEICREHTLITELRHVSAAYYRYKKQFYLYEKARNTQFIEGTAIAISNYTNVQNGMGVVAAYTPFIDSLHVPRDSVMTRSLYD
jgi:hypothetical protein